MSAATVVTILHSSNRAGVLVVGYLVTLGVFATVQWLQYWDFART
jgi:hypothetical protein